MNVLHINQSDIGGGAAIVSYRLHRALIEQGITSRMLVGDRRSDDALVQRVPFPGLPERLVGRITDSLGWQYAYFRSARDLSEHPWVREADVISLHNLHSGYVNYRHLPVIAAGKPVVLTPHDMWSFTGHCGFSFECDRYTFGCGKCPHPDTYPSVKHDATAMEWKTKQQAFGQLRLRIAACSDWMARCVGQSLLKGSPIHRIPYGLNLQSYQPLDRSACRSALRIEAGKPVIMFAAASLSDPRKGADLLLGALRHLPMTLRNGALLLTMGNGGQDLASKVGMQSVNLGYVEEDRLKAVAYSAADIFVVPTRADNFPLVMMESIACGTPVCSFRVGGVPELVRSGITGELASPENVEELAAIIDQMLRAPEKLRATCRAVAEAEFSDRLMAQRYIDLFQLMLAAAVA